MNYFVILFKNNKKKKILKSFITENKAIEFYNKKVKESREVLFEKSFENGKECDYKISLVSKKHTNEQIYYTDELGRNIIINPKIEDGKYIVRMDFYRIEEKIFDLNKNSKITTNQFIKSYLKKDNFYMISKINNKVIVQNDNEVKLFSCKTESESERFLNNLQMVSEVKNFMIVFDVSSAQKKYLYEILYNMGFKKDMLYRKSTTHPKEK